MRVILIILLSISSLFANYSITYANLKLGKIENISSVKDNYLDIKVTNPIARFLLGKKRVFFYNNTYKQKMQNSVYKYKKDKYSIIEILKKAISNNLQNGKIVVSENKYIEIKEEGDYKFKYISKGKVKSYGTFVIKNSEFISLIDEKNHVKIIKN